MKPELDWPAIHEDPKNPQFSKGQQVRCVRGEPSEGLNKGTVYTVFACTHSGFSWMVQTTLLPMAFSACRFESVE